jgi:hypothetical protein
MVLYLDIYNHILMLETTQCVGCGVVFEYQSYNFHSPPKYHSKECYCKTKHNTCSEQRTCAQCGKLFSVAKSELRKGKNRGIFCSNDCYRKHNVKGNHPRYRGGDEQKVCEICGALFTVERPREHTARFCSIKCKGVWHSRVFTGESHPRYSKIQVPCSVCGKLTSMAPHRLTHEITCSNECFRKYMSQRMSGVNHPQFNNWASKFPYCHKFDEKRRRATRNFFGNRCIMCGKHVTENIARNNKRILIQMELSVHHVDRNKDAGCSGTPFNLVPLCKSCHDGDRNENMEEYVAYITKTLTEGFKWGIWSEQEYMEKVMYPE